MDRLTCLLLILMLVTDPDCYSLFRKYRPVYAELDEWPRINFETVGASCPFEKPKVKNGLAEKEMEPMSDKETNKDASSQEMRWNFSSSL